MVRLSVSSASLFPCDMKRPWEIFSFGKIESNYFAFEAKILEKVGFDDYGVSYHPTISMDSRCIVEANRYLTINSIDIPDVVKFFDQRMINEFKKKQPWKELLVNQLRHVAWRLMNVPTTSILESKVKYLLDNTCIKDLRVSSRSLIDKNEYAVITALCEKYQDITISVEMDNFSHKSASSYIDCVEELNELHAGEVGFAIDVAHIMQGVASGKWQSVESFIEKVGKSSANILTFDLNPVRIKDQKKYDSGNTEDTEEAMDEVIGMHCEFDKNACDYLMILKTIASYDNCKIKEVVIETNPRERNELMKNNSFIEYLREIGRTIELEVKI